MSTTSFIDALEDKYADCDVSVSSSMFVLKNMDVAGTKGKVRVPREMSLHRLGVSCAGDTDRIKEICCQVTSLDVTNNQLTDWKEIFTILSCMPKVSFLNLSENDLTQPLPETDVTFPNIKGLVLNSTSVPLETVDALLKIMPNVTELHLCMNGYSSVTSPCQHLGITTLYMNANKFTDFEEILKLSDIFPDLRQLLILQNAFWCLPEAERLQCKFPKLECLNITETKIDSWEELEKFKHFPLLKDIRMKDIPLFKEMEEKLRRQLIIGFLPNITKLNISDISPEERITAERMFIRHFVKQDVKPARSAELEAKHGKLGPLVDIDMKAPTCCTVAVHMEERVTMKKVDVRLTVTEFKTLLSEEVAGGPTSKFRLFHDSVNSWVGTEELKDTKTTSRSLHSLPIADGDRFYVDLK